MIKYYFRYNVLDLWSRMVILSSLVIRVIEIKSISLNLEIRTWCTLGIVLLTCVCDILHICMD